MPHTITILSAAQQAKVLGVLSVGCDRETAANIVGCTVEELGGAMQHDPEFVSEVRRTEAAVEFAHMRVIYKAAKEDDQWRAAIWWLEQRAPERFVSRGPGTVTRAHLKAFVKMLGEHLNEDIRDPADRERVLARLKQMHDIANRINNVLWNIDTAGDGDVETETEESAELPPVSLLS